jgi:hypothetical protein
MTLQEKIHEFIRETDNIEEEILKDNLEDLLSKTPKAEKEFLYSAFIQGFTYACNCLLQLCQTSKINPEI